MALTGGTEFRFALRIEGGGGEIRRSSEVVDICKDCDKGLATNSTFIFNRIRTYSTASVLRLLCHAVRCSHSPTFEPVISCTERNVPSIDDEERVVTVQHIC
jgi:hypothetical protein